MKKVIETSNSSLISGMNKAADILCKTLGPFGTNVAIGRKFQKPIMANDAGTISENINFDNESEQIGAEIIKDATSSTENTTKDGRTSTIAILRHLVNKSIEKTTGLSGLKPIEVSRAIRREMLMATELLLEEKKEIESKEELYNIALASSQNEEIAKIISDMFYEFGKDIVVTVEDNFQDIISVVHKTGIEIPFKPISEMLAKNIENTPVLVLDESIKSVIQIKDTYDKLVSSGVFSLLIIANDFDDSVVKEFHTLDGSFSIIPIKIPKSNKELYEDIASITGSKVVTDTIKPEDIGIATSVICSEKVIISGNNNQEKYIEKLLSKEIDSHYDKEMLEQRIARLKNGVFTIKIGSSIEQEREFIKLKTKDGVASVKNTMNGGYVSGGGVALKNVAEKMKESLIAESLMEPYRIIQESNGAPFEIPDSVIDSFKTVEQEIITACTLASNIVTCHASIADKEEEDGDVI